MQVWQDSSLSLPHPTLEQQARHSVQQDQVLYVVLAIQSLLRYLHLFVTIEATFAHKAAPLTLCKAATEGLKEGDQCVRPVAGTEGLVLLDFGAQD